MTQPSSKIQQRPSALNTPLQENLAGIMGREGVRREPQEARFATAAENLFQQQIRVSRTFSLVFPLIFLIANVGQAAILYFGGRQIINGTLTFGEWQKFSLYLAFVFFPLGQLGLIISQMSQASASADRIFEIMDAESEVTDKAGASTLPPVEGKVGFEDVVFRYFGSSKPVLQGVSFEAEPGQTVALLGATGSGKTTIINLIPRFYDDRRRVNTRIRRLRTAAISDRHRPRTNLFSGTIRENIARRPRPATNHRAAKAAAEFIALPGGIHAGRRRGYHAQRRKATHRHRTARTEPHLILVFDVKRGHRDGAQIQRVGPSMEGRTNRHRATSARYGAPTRSWSSRTAGGSGTRTRN
jgi:ATP-binding cassette subfamily B protein